MRSRLYLDRAKSEDGDEPDPALRVLKLLKSNYAPTGTEIKLRWEAGRFKLDGFGAGNFDRMAAEQRAEAIFLDLLRLLKQQGREVSASWSKAYAPAVFAAHPRSEGISKKTFSSAMERLLAAGTITVETSGPPSKRRERIVLSG